LATGGRCKTAPLGSLLRSLRWLQFLYRWVPQIHSTAAQCFATPDRDGGATMNGSQEGHNGFEGIASGCVLLAAASYLASHLAILIGLPFIWVEDETRVLPIILILL